MLREMWGRQERTKTGRSRQERERERGGWERLSDEAVKKLWAANQS